LELSEHRKPHVDGDQLIIQVNFDVRFCICHLSGTVLNGGTSQVQILSGLFVTLGLLVSEYAVVDYSISLDPIVLSLKVNVSFDPAGTRSLFPLSLSAATTFF